MQKRQPDEKLVLQHMVLPVCINSCGNTTPRLAGRTYVELPYENGASGE